MRIDHHDYFMTIAQVVALRSTCLRARVGAVMVHENRILSTGYNGAPCGFPHCTPNTCNPQIDHCRATVHAEMNAIVNAARHGTALKDATLYCTHPVCEACARVLINLGIRAVYLGSGSYDQGGIDLLRTAGIPVFHKATHQS